MTMELKKLSLLVKKTCLQASDEGNCEKSHKTDASVEKKKSSLPAWFE